MQATNFLSMKAIKFVYGYLLHLSDMIDNGYILYPNENIIGGYILYPSRHICKWIYDH